MSKYAGLVAEKNIPQSEPLDARQVPNNAGGHVYAVSLWDRLDRILILGADSPTYYQSARELSSEARASLASCWDADATRTASRIAEVSASGRAPKNSHAIFALATGAAHASQVVRAAALSKLTDVCRTSTHLFEFVEIVRSLGRGWGPMLQRAVGGWYTSRSASQLALQGVKYRSRGQYTHRRIIHTAHPERVLPAQPDRDAVMRWMAGTLKADDAARSALPPLVLAHEEAMASTDVETWTRLVREHNLPWEALPTEANAEAEVWRAHIPHMGLTALLRNLANMTRLGAIGPLSAEEGIVVGRLSDEAELRRARIHPMQILTAAVVYQRGRSGGQVMQNGRWVQRPERSWQPSQAILAALDRAFYASFAATEPTGLRHLLALDVSVSMSSAISGSEVLSCAQASAAMALVTASTEPASHVMAFADGFRDAGIRTGMTLAKAHRKVANVNFGGTDCSLPMLWALEKKVPVDVFVVLTDSETWAGREHPMSALRRYRSAMGIPAQLVVVGMGIPAQLVVVGMTSTGFSIADPADPGCLDVVGFDGQAPVVIADHLRRGHAALSGARK